MTDPTDAQARERVIHELAAVLDPPAWDERNVKVSETLGAILSRRRGGSLVHARRAVMAGCVRPEPLSEDDERDVQDALARASEMEMYSIGSWLPPQAVLAREVRRLRGAR